MSLHFEFATASRILFGTGLIAQAGGEAKSLGQHPFVVTGRHPERAQPLLASLQASGLPSDVFPIDGEPDLGAVEAGARLARERNCDLVIGFGGGSAIDAAKAIAAIATNPGDIHDYLEVIGQSKPLIQTPLPCLAIPTTAGAGAEVTRNAVLRSREFRVKVSLRSPLLLPRLALVDPQLTHHLPPDVTVATGLDALTQLIEPFLSNRANPLVDALCLEGLSAIARSLRRAVLDGEHPPAREDMALASLLGGIALANSGLGAVHGFAAPIGGRFDAPHGAVCAALLPHVLEANLRALREREPGHRAVQRMDQVGRILSAAPHAGADDAIAWIRETCSHLGVRGLSSWGLKADDAPILVEQASAASSMKGNPIRLTQAELSAILLAALPNPSP